MKKLIAIIAVLVLVFALAVPVMAAEGLDDNRPTPTRTFDGEAFRVGEDGQVFIRLRQFAYLFNATVEWEQETRTAIITGLDGATMRMVVEEEGGFIEDGVSWIPLWHASWLQHMLFVTPPVERIDLTLWERERFAEVRETSFSTDLPHGEIAVNYIEYMSDNLGARSAFTYAELEAAVWIVEELLAMGHDWYNISVQEFTYWDIRGMEVGLWGRLHWWSVTSPMILGVDREYQLRPDRVSQNVVLTIPGQSESTIIVGAHYDSPPYPSASDNASGTALLLESAQRMLEQENYHTIVYVFFGAEEVGLIGAAYFYETLSEEERDNIVMMVNADVLIEGPYILYGAGGQPQFDDVEVTEELVEAVIEALIEDLLERADELIEMFKEWGMVIDDYEEFINTMIEEQTASVPYFPDDFLLQTAYQFGLIEAETNYLAIQISEIAAALTAENDFELISFPDLIHLPSDHLIFLFAGFTVVNFAGLERVENLTDELKELIHRYMEVGDGFMATILHSPHDEFHTIESIWPGMMNTNLRAFVMFLEEILTTNFS